MEVQALPLGWVHTPGHRPRLASASRAAELKILPSRPSGTGPHSWVLGCRKLQGAGGAGQSVRPGVGNRVQPQLLSSLTALRGLWRAQMQPAERWQVGWCSPLQAPRLRGTQAAAAAAAAATPATLTGEPWGRRPVRPRPWGWFLPGRGCLRAGAVSSPLHPPSLLAEDLCLAKCGEGGHGMYW